MATNNGDRARLDRAERDIRELDLRVRENSKLLASIPFIRDAVDRVEATCEETADRVDGISRENRDYLDQKLTALRQADTEKQKISVQRLAIWVGGLMVLAAAIVGAIASLISAGAI